MQIFTNFIEADWTLKVIVVWVEPIVVSHTADAQSQQSISVLINFEIFSKFFTITADFESLINKMIMLFCGKNRYTMFDLNYLKVHIICFSFLFINLVYYDKINIYFQHLPVL